MRPQDAHVCNKERKVNKCYGLKKIILGITQNSYKELRKQCCTAQGLSTVTGLPCPRYGKVGSGSRNSLLLRWVTRVRRCIQFWCDADCRRARGVVSISGAAPRRLCLTITSRARRPPTWGDAAPSLTFHAPGRVTLYCLPSNVNSKLSKAPDGMETSRCARRLQQQTEQRINYKWRCINFYSYHTYITLTG